MKDTNWGRSSLLLLFLIITFGLSCSDDDCIECPDSTRLFTVNVVDTLGDPVEGIRVGSINKHYNAYHPGKVSKANSNTQISFTIPTSSFVKLYITNYYAETVKILIDSVEQAAGIYTVQWDGTDSLDEAVLSGYYYFHLWAQNENETFDDSRAFVLETAPSPYASIIGNTDSNGNLSTDDTLYFPGLLGQPPTITPRDESGEPYDSLFHYKDSVTITLSDPLSPDEFIYIDKLLKRSPNNFNLVWDPTLAE